MSRFAPTEITVRVREDAEGGRLYISWRGTAFDELKAIWKADWPRHSDCTYSGEAKAWSLPLARRVRLQDWLHAHVDPAAITWQDEPASHSYSNSRTGSGRYHHQGHTVGTSTAVAPALEQALRVLYLVPEAPPWAAEVMYRAALKRCHPDVGGDHDQAVALTEAMAIIREHVDRSA